MLWVGEWSKIAGLEQNYAEYMGNESAVQTIYAELNLIFTVPSKEERGLNPSVKFD